MCHYEKEWLDSYPIEFKPKLYKRYIDDIFVMFQSRDHIKKFVNIFVKFWSRDHMKKFVDYMNTKHPNIRFIFETEDQNSLSFLDIKIIRNTEKRKHLKCQLREKVQSVVFLLISRVFF